MNGEIVEMGCPCCETILRISSDNATRLFTAALTKFGEGDITLDISMLPDVDWTAEVSEEVIAQAVDDATSLSPRHRQRKRGSRRARRRP